MPRQPSAACSARSATNTEWAAFVGEEAAIVERHYRRIDGVYAPTELAHPVRGILRIGHRAVRIVRETQRELRDGYDSLDIVHRMQRRLEPLARRENRLWRMVGVKTCAA